MSIAALAVYSLASCDENSSSSSVKDDKVIENTFQDQLKNIRVTLIYENPNVDFNKTQDGGLMVNLLMRHLVDLIIRFI